MVEKHEIPRGELDISSLEWIKQHPKEFDGLDFEVNPGFHPTTLKNSEIISTKYSYKKVNIEGYNLDLAGRDDVIRSKFRTDRALNLYLGRGKSYVETTIELDEDETDIVTEVSVVRHDEEHLLPRGLARTFFSASNDFLQNLSNESQKNVIHRVDRSPGYDGVELSEEDWDRMFLPMLEKGGYERTTENTFSKTFYPENVERNTTSKT